MENSSLLRRLALLKANPQLAETLPQGELLSLLNEVVVAFNALKTAVETNKIQGPKGEDGKDARELVPGVDYLTKEQSDSFIQGLEQSYNRLSLDLEARLASLRDGSDGKDAEITPEIVAEAAQMAAQLIDLPDFEALFATIVQTNPAIVRDGLELLPDGEKLSQEAIEDLPRTLDDIRDSIIRSRGGGGPGKTQVYEFIRQATADGTIPTTSDINIAYQSTAPISPEDGDLWVDTSVRLDLPVTSADITSIVALTQVEYDALGTPDPSTLYVITA